MVSVFTTPQDKLVGPERMRAGPNEEPVRVIPDMTVKITRAKWDRGGSSDRQVVLVIEAKRLFIDSPGSACIPTFSNTYSLMRPLQQAYTRGLIFKQGR